MLVIAIGGPEIPKGITWLIDDKECLSYDRLKLAIKTGVEKKMKTTNKIEFENFLICGENRVITRDCIEEAIHSVSLVIVPARKLRRPLGRMKTDKAPRDWNERMTSLENSFGNTRIEESLADVGFYNLYPNGKEKIINCTTCLTHQRFTNDFLPALDQHALVNPRCPKLSALGNEMIDITANISSWLKELCNIARRCNHIEETWDTLMFNQRLPKQGVEYEKTDLKCVICRTNQPSILRLPCLHLNLCIPCYQQKLKFSDNGKCEICQEKIHMSCRVMN